MRIVAIIQARMSSSRLPGKVLLDIAGKPMLARVVTRVRRITQLDDVLVATTTDSSDAPVAEYCRSMDIPYTRGSLYDVLDRYHQAALQARADIVVRITADCPVIDPVLVDGVIKVLWDGSFDFACNRLPPPWHRTYPIGLDAEVCTFSALERAWQEAREPQQREHVMPFFYQGVQLSYQTDCLEVGFSPRGFKVALLHYTVDYGAYRWTVDTSEDLEFVRQIYACFPGRDDFSWLDVLDLVHRKPQLMEINADVRHKTLKDIDTRATPH